MVAAIALTDPASTPAAELGEQLRYLFNSPGKMIFMETATLLLVVVLDKHINIDFTMLAVASASENQNPGSMA
jgi:hypothetical protein